VARLLKDERMQAGLKDQVILVDEAGLLGTRTMGRLFDLGNRLDARFLLVGDTRQHGPVERSSALKLLEEQAGVLPAEIREIQRQRADYKMAVRALSEGRTDAGFRQLDKLGWIREVSEPERYRALATDYIAAVTGGKTALVVSPTHLEGEWITDEIRSRLKAIGKLRNSERRLPTLENVNLTEAERRDPVNYAPGDVLVYHQHAKGVRKGARMVVGDGPLPVEQADRFQVFRSGRLPVAPGDLVRITRNGHSADGKHALNNGAVYRVTQFNRRGDLVLENGWTVARDFGFLSHGYTLTSHASQGRTVDRVFIGQSSHSFPASSREQFYVSVSRAREQATIYTDDKRALLDAVSRRDDRISATELLGDRDHEVGRPASRLPPELVHDELSRSELHRET
jgi:hypothetical protein